jgi:aspartate aminotransferase
MKFYGASDAASDARGPLAGDGLPDHLATLPAIPLTSEVGPSAAWLDPRVRGASPAPTMVIDERSRSLSAAGRDIVRLGLGQSPFPVPDPVAEALRRHAHERDYLPVRGLPALREAVAAHLSRHAGLEYDAGRILIGPGSKQLLFLVQMVVDANLLLPSPSWVSYGPQARMAGRRVHWLPTQRADRWHLDPDVLDTWCRANPGRRILLLNYPNNPNGATMTRARLQAIAETARRHGLLIVSDEIYGLVDHAGTHASIASYYPEGTVVTSGLSKWCGAGGWRLGTLALPLGMEWLGDALAAASSETHTTVSAPIQYAAVTAFRGGPEIDGYLAQSRRVLRAVGQRCADILGSAGFDVDTPDGGFYLFPDAAPFRGRLAARGIDGGASLCARLLDEAGVAALPGAAFGRPAAELTFRLSYVDFDGARALEASARVPEGTDLDAGFVREYAGRVIEGMARLADWVGAAD